MKKNMLLMPSKQIGSAVQECIWSNLKINSVIMTGATPVFVDADKETFCIDAHKIEEKISAKTKAIIAVHIYGHPCAMDRIMHLARKYNLKVIEDAAESHGAEYKGKKCG